MYNQYKNDGRFAFYCIDIPLIRDTAGMAEYMIRKRNYTFPVMIASTGLDSLFTLEVFLIVTVLQHDSILFKGSIDQAEAGGRAVEVSTFSAIPLRFFFGIEFAKNQKTNHYEIRT